MNYVSTAFPHDKHEPRGAVLHAQPKQGGLWMPETIPLIDEEQLQTLQHNASLSKTAFQVMCMFGMDKVLGEVELMHACSDAFATDDIPEPRVQMAQVHTSSESEGINVNVVEMFHGPTGSFKDYGARMMGAFGRRVIAGRCVVATSGDTGSAAGDAMGGMANMPTTILYPGDERISEIQRRHIGSRKGCLAVEVGDDFDACQHIAKQMINQPSLVTMNTDGWSPWVSCNSISIVRLLAQVSYFVHLFVVQEWYTFVDGESTVIAIPSGNLGHVTAALIAGQMLQFDQKRHVILAVTNTNDAFFRWWIDLTRNDVDKDPKLIPAERTLSTAMDVSVPSNLARVRHLFRFYPHLRDVLSVTRIADGLASYLMTYTCPQMDYAMCPHTATALCGLQEMFHGGFNAYFLVSTAHPAKFPQPQHDVLCNIPSRPEPRQFEVSDDQVAYLRCFDPNKTGALLTRMAIGHMGVFINEMDVAEQMCALLAKRDPDSNWKLLVIPADEVKGTPPGFIVHRGNMSDTFRRLLLDDFFCKWTESTGKFPNINLVRSVCERRPRLGFVRPEVADRAMKDPDAFKGLDALLVSTSAERAATALADWIVHPK